MPERGVPIEELLVHAGWMRGLAFSLTGHDEDADDVVQDAWVSALRSPPQEPERARSWLWRVIHNHVFERQRHAAVANRALARIATDAVVDSQAESTARLELEVRIGQLVLELPERERAVVIARYYRRLSCAQIARDTEESANTIRSRLRRALTRLRRQLADPDDGGLAGTLAPLLGRGAPPPATARLSVARSARAVARSARVWAAAAVFLTAAAIVIVAVMPRRRSQGPPLVDRGSRASEEVATASRTHAFRSRERQERAESISGEDRPGYPCDIEPSGTRVSISGHLEALFANPEAAQAPWQLDVRVIAPGERPDDVPSQKLSVATAAFESEVQLDRDITDIAEIRVTARHPSFLPLEWSEPVPPGETRRVLLTYAPAPRPASQFAVRVMSPSGAPAPGAEIALAEVRPGQRRDARAEIQRTDGEGLATLQATPGSQVYVIAWNDVAAPVVRRLVAPQAGEDEAVTVTLAPGRTISGTIRSRDPRLLRELSVRYRADAGDVYVSLPNRGLWLGGDRAWRATREVPVGPSGTYTMSGVGWGAGEIEVFHRLASGDALARVQVSPATGDRVPDLSFDPVRVRIRVSDSDGPVVGAFVDVDCPPPVPSLVTDDDGRAVLLAAPSAVYGVTVRGPRREPIVTTLYAPGAGESTEVTLDVPPRERGSQWIIEPYGVDGALPERLGVALYRDEPAATLVEPPVLLEGALMGGVYVVRDMPRGQFRASLRLGSAWMEARSHFVDAELPLDASEGERAPSRVTFIRGGRFKIAVFGQDGEPLRAACVVSGQGREDWGVRFSGGALTKAIGAASRPGSDGYSMSDRCLPPGTYALRLEGHGMQSAVRHVSIGSGSVATTDVILLAE